MTRKKDDIETLVEHQAGRIMEQSEELEQRRQQCLDLRDRNLALELELERAKSIARASVTLRSGDYEVTWESNNGHILSRPRARVREDWIRWFAGSYATQEDASHAWVASSAFALWDELEKRFQIERDSAKADSTPEGEG